MSELLKNAESKETVAEKVEKKLKEETKNSKTNNFAKPIIEHLLKRCEEDAGLAEDILKVGKTWEKCFSYLASKAMKLKVGNCAAVEDEVVYEWAEDYYRKEDKPDPAKKADTKKPIEKKIIEKVAETEKKEPKKAQKKESKKKSSKPQMEEAITGQISLFDLM